MRPWTSDDVDFAFDLYSRVEVQRFIGSPPRVMVHRSEAVERIARWRELRDPVLGVWAAEDRESGNLLGTLLLKPIPASGNTLPLQPSGEVEIGWHFHPDAWGCGYATEGAAAVLRHARDNGLDTVIAVTNPHNTASQAVCRRIGLTHLGLTAKYYNEVCELFTSAPPGPPGP